MLDARLLETTTSICPLYIRLFAVHENESTMSANDVLLLVASETRATIEATGLLLFRKEIKITERSGDSRPCLTWDVEVVYGEDDADAPLIVGKEAKQNA